MSDALASLTFDEVRTNVTFIAHLCTATLGILAIWGLIRHRGKIGAFVRLVSHSVATERINKIKGTLGQLDSLNYDVKEQRKKIIAILGQLAGMIQLFASRQTTFKEVRAQLLDLTANPASLSEATKRRISEELHGLIDEQGFAAALDLMEESNGHKSS